MTDSLLLRDGQISLETRVSGPSLVPRGAPNFPGRKQLQSETENGDVSPVLRYSNSIAERIPHGTSGHRDVIIWELEFMSKVTSIVEKMLLGANWRWS